MDVLNKEAVRILHILGNKDVRHIDTTVGPEQEYFLVDKDLYKKEKRPDLLRTYSFWGFRTKKDRKWKIITSEP